MKFILRSPVLLFLVAWCSYTLEYMSIGDMCRRVMDGFKSKVSERVVLGAVVVLFVIAVLAIELPRLW